MMQLRTQQEVSAIEVHKTLDIPLGYYDIPFDYSVVPRELHNMAKRLLLALPAQFPRSRDSLYGLTSRGTQEPGGGEVDLPAPIVALPTLPVVNNQTLAAQAVKETLAPSLFTEAGKGEGVAFEGAIVPGGTVTLPLAGSDGGDERGESEEPPKLKDE
jgi:hypothetical protein